MEVCDRAAVWQEFIMNQFLSISSSKLLQAYTANATCCLPLDLYTTLNFSKNFHLACGRDSYLFIRVQVDMVGSKPELEKR